MQNFIRQYNEIVTLGVDVKNLIRSVNPRFIDPNVEVELEKLAEYIHNFSFSKDRNRYDLGDAIIKLSHYLKLVSLNLNTYKSKFVRTANDILNRLVTVHNKLYFK
ncbi:hypothetical protein ACVWU4_000939 [Campylobacter coli]